MRKENGRLRLSKAEEVLNLRITKSKEDNPFGLE